MTLVIGIDPGLVHTGVVAMAFDPAHRRLVVSHIAIDGINGKAVADWIGNEEYLAKANADAFIEGYRQRGHLSTDKEMVEGVAEIKKATGGKVLLNTGVKKVVKRALMELVGVWDFSTKTHHADLRSAARIGLFGMMKEDLLNPVLTDVVRAHLAGRTWDVRLA